MLGGRLAPCFAAPHPCVPPDRQALGFERVHERLDARTVFGLVRNEDVRHALPPRLLSLGANPVECEMTGSVRQALSQAQRPCVARGVLLTGFLIGAAA